MFERMKKRRKEKRMANVAILMISNKGVCGKWTCEDCPIHEEMVRDGVRKTHNEVIGVSAAEPTNCNHSEVYRQAKLAWLRRWLDHYDPNWNSKSQSGTCPYGCTWVPYHIAHRWG